MALKKDIILENSITVKYHRINRIDIRTNQIILISVISYLNDIEREREKEFDYDTGNSLILFKKEWTEEVEYKDKYSIKEAYEYLKTLEKFSEAEDC